MSHASALTAPCANTSSSFDVSAWNLLDAVTKGFPVRSATAAATARSKPSGALSPVPTAVPPSASSRREDSAAVSSSRSRARLVRQPEISCAKVMGVASCKCVRPDFSTSAFSASRCRRVCSNAETAGRRRSSTTRQAAICIAVGKVSFEDCDILTSSFGCRSFFPASSLPRLAMTSLTFMFDCVPEPVCHTTSGKCPSSSPARISSQTRPIRAHFSALIRAGSSSRLAMAAAFFRTANARMISAGIVSIPTPMGKFSCERCVCAPQ